MGDYGGYGDIGEANIRALQDEPGAYVRTGGYGHRQLWLPDNEDNRELIERLERDYPIYCEDSLSEVQQEWADEAWEDFGRWDSLRDLGKAWGKAYAWEKGGPLFPDDKMDKARWAAESRGDGTFEWIYEYSGACMRLDKERWRKCVCEALGWPLVDLECEGERAMLHDWFLEQGREEEAQSLADCFGMGVSR